MEQALEIALAFLFTNDMHYNNQVKRDMLEARDPHIFTNSKSRVFTFINLCIHPLTFDALYAKIRSGAPLTSREYGAVKGVLMGLIVLVNRKHSKSYISVDAYTPDFIDFIRTDRTNDPVRFLLSMKVYMYRFMLIVGLRVAFGIDWKKFVTDVLDLPREPRCRTYHALLTHTLVRNLCKVYAIWKNYRNPAEEGYVAGENDIGTLIDKCAESKKSLPSSDLYLLFWALNSELPSSSLTYRKRAAYAIDTAQEGFAIMTTEYTDWKTRKNNVS